MNDYFEYQGTPWQVDPNCTPCFYQNAFYNHRTMQAGRSAQTPQVQQYIQNQTEQQTEQQAHIYQPHYVTYPASFSSAYAMLIAGPDYPSITGLVTFADTTRGVLVCADLKGLPPYQPSSGDKRPVGPHGFHIHERGLCEMGDKEKPFEGCGGHWNPTNQPHGNHAGDFPVLMADSNGRARMCFITDRFVVDEILGRSVMVHENPDDYRSQPAGNSGKRIACGSIKPWNSFQQYEH